MNSVIFTHGLRFIMCVVIQILVFRQVRFGWETFDYVHIIVYPYFIMFLPIKTSRPLLIALGFLIGITVDIFYHTPGVHAAAGTFSAFVRPIILNLMAPRGGYNLNDSPTMVKFGFSWFGVYAGSLLFLHLLFYFSMEVFTPVKIGDISLRTIFSFFASIIFILAYVGAVKPTE